MCYNTEKQNKIDVLLAVGGGTLQGFKPLTPKDVEAIFRMCP